jgi:hypothetical protein
MLPLQVPANADSVDHKVALAAYERAIPDTLFSRISCWLYTRYRLARVLPEQWFQSLSMLPLASIVATSLFVAQA